MPVINLDRLLNLFLQDISVRYGKVERVRVANLEVAPLWINYEVSLRSLLIDALCVVEIDSSRIVNFYVEDIAQLSY